MKQIPRGWYKCTNKVILDDVQRVCDVAKEYGLIDYTPEVYIFKSSRTYGWARYSTKVTDDAIPWFRRRIELRKPIVGINEQFVLQNPKGALQTIIHEISHITVYEHNKKNDEQRWAEGHSGLWRSHYYKIGKKFGLKLSDITRLSDFSSIGVELTERKSTTSYKYSLYCPKCGKQWLYKTNCDCIKRPYRWQCQKCKQKLESKKI